MSRRLFTLVVALAAIGAPLSASAQFGTSRGAGTVRCESDNYRTEVCRVDTRGGVRLVRQESDSPCVRGRTWGYDSRGIWVAQGCGGRFEVGNARVARNTYNNGYYGSSSPYYGNSSYGSPYYGNGSQYGSAYPYGNSSTYSGSNPLTQVLGAVLGSGGYNNYGNSAYGNNGYYGNNGGYYGNTSSYNGRQPQVFRCESDNGQPRFCRLPFQAQRIDLRRQLSRTQCAEGYTWGRQSDGVWVEQGCRAEFIVY